MVSVAVLPRRRPILAVAEAMPNRVRVCYLSKVLLDQNLTTYKLCTMLEFA